MADLGPDDPGHAQAPWLDLLPLLQWQQWQLRFKLDPLWLKGTRATTIKQGIRRWTLVPVTFKTSNNGAQELF